MHEVEAVVGLLLGMTAVAALARRTSVPAPVLLAVAGLALGLLPGIPDVRVDPDLVLVLVLPPLLYAAAVDLPTKQVRADLLPIAALALGLVVVSIVAVGLVAVLLVPGLPLAAGLTLGAILAATDPVAIAALARRLSLPRRLLTIVQAESLLNDATSLVAYRIAVAAAVSGTGLSFWRAGAQFLLVAGGGALVGLVVAAVVAWVRRRVDDPLAENALSLLTPFVAFLPAEAAGWSGVTAVVFCGLYLGPRLPGLSSSVTRMQEQATWQVLVFLLEGAVFALVGLQLPALVAGLDGRSLVQVLSWALLIAAVLVTVRVAWAFPAAYLPWLLRRSGRRAGRVPWQLPAVFAWTGTRGVVALAAALALPLTTRAGPRFPERDVLLVLSSSVILITLVGQGLTLGPLARRLGVGADREAELREEMLARTRAAQAALAQLDALDGDGSVPADVVERVRGQLEERITAAGVDSYRRLRRELLQAERDEVVRLRDRGEIGDAVLRRVQRGIDLEEGALTEGGP
jgi:Na+/H+ antiporter